MITWTEGMRVYIPNRDGYGIVSDIQHIGEDVILRITPDGDYPETILRRPKDVYLTGIEDNIAEIYRQGARITAAQVIEMENLTRASNDAFNEVSVPIDQLVGDYNEYWSGRVWAAIYRRVFTSTGDYQLAAVIAGFGADAVFAEIHRPYISSAAYIAIAKPWITVFGV